MTCDISKTNVPVDYKDLPLDEASFKNIACRFERMTECFGQNTALHTAEEKTTYEDLNHQANRIAHAVLGYSKGRHQHVALLFEQGMDAIASTLGVLKAGCAFIPLDASNPPAKLIEICQNGEPILLLTNTDNWTFAEEIAQDNISLTDVNCLPPELPDTNPEVTIDGDSTAYLFYTSGSTGKPKGVRQTQRNLFHFIRVYSESLAVSSKDRLSLLYSLGFSASNMDVFSALLNGAALYPYDIRKRGTTALADWIDNSQISILHTVPTVFRHLTANMDETCVLDNVRGIDLGGETVFRSDVALFKKHFRKDCLLINHLAATEASVIAQYPIDPSFDYDNEMMPVGYPSEGIRIQIAGPDGQEMATGQAGELIIHSPYISPGYWNLPELNRTVFTEDDQIPGNRIYRSGDLGYIGEDGKIYFLGRKDSRIKIRGHSVDTNEIEAAIRNCAHVKDIAVVARRIEKDSPAQLAAFLVRNPEKKVDLDELRNSLSTCLATYMMPADFIFMSALPENASGKIDRKALTELTLREERSNRVYLPPENDTEHLVAKLYNSILSLNQVSRSDDFFMLGGNSLQATELHTFVEATFAIQIPLNILLTDATVTGVSSAIEKFKLQKSAPQDSHKKALLPLRETGSNPILYLLHGAKGQAFVSPDFLNILGDSQPVYAFQASGLEFSPKQRCTIEEMATLYIAAIKKVQAKGPYLIGSICAGCMLAIEMAHQLRAEDETVGPLLLIDPPGNPPGERRWNQRARRNLTLWIKHRFSGRHKKKLIKTLKTQIKKGRITLDTADQNLLEEALRTAFKFSLALIRHHIRPYDGPVFILGSRERLSKEKGNLRKKLTGDVRVFDVANTHNEIHVVGNTRFEKMLRQSMEIALKKMNCLQEAAGQHKLTEPAGTPAFREKTERP